MSGLKTLVRAQRTNDLSAQRWSQAYSAAFFTVSCLLITSPSTEDNRHLPTLVENSRHFRLGMPLQHLNDLDIGSTLQQTRCKIVPQSVRRHPLLEFGKLAVQNLTIFAVIRPSPHTLGCRSYPIRRARFAMRTLLARRGAQSDLPC